MFATLNNLAQRTRQHHGIEHATIHILSGRFPGQRFTGLSDPTGFTIFGEVDEEAMRRAAGDALLRLQAGEKSLAIHPNCGTNLATTGILATAAAMIGAAGRGRGLLDKFATALLLVIPAIIISRPIGMRIQGYTTTGDVGDRWLVDIRPIKIGGVHAHRVTFDH
jgi:hypothetical protein